MRFSRKSCSRRSLVIVWPRRCLACCPGLMVRSRLLEDSVMQNYSEETTIRARLARYLTRRDSLLTFQQWFFPATWDIDEQAPEGLRTLVSGIALLLAEYTGGYWTESELRRELKAIIGYY